MENYQILGLLEQKQEQIIKQLIPNIKTASNILRKRADLSTYEYNVAIQTLKQKGLIKGEKLPLDNRMNMYYLTKKGEKIRGLLYESQI